MLTSIIIAALASSLLTGGVMYSIDKRSKSSDQNTAEIINAVASVKSEVAEAQLITTKNLTNTDLLKVPCSSEYIVAHDDLLCREMFCRLQARGLDEGSSAQECEQISNIKNSLIIFKTCDGLDNACVGIFTTRK